MTGALAAVSDLEELVGEVGRIDQRVVLRPVARRVEPPVPGQVHVLVVDD